jgi:heptosyltransferase-2
MKIKYLRLIDKYIGTIACAMLYIFEKSLRLHFKNNLKEDSILKILIIKFWGFGSIILAKDAFWAIRNRYPKAYLCAFTLSENKPVYEMLGIFDEIFTVELGHILKFLNQLKKNIFLIRHNDFDIAFDLEFTSRFSAIITYLSKAKRRIGFNYRGIFRGGCFTDEIQFNEDIKLKDSFLNLVSTVIKLDHFSFIPSKLKIKKNDCEFVDNFLQNEGLSEKDLLIGLNVNASDLCLLRRWPKEYFADLAGDLIRRYSAELIFIGKKEEAAYVKEVLKNIPFDDNLHDFTGKITLAQLAYLLGKFRLFITNDSGPLHLAVYLGVPTVSFFGPETPDIYGPQGDSHIVFYKNLDCSPCIRIKNYKQFNCLNDHRCLREIKPQEVINEIERKGILR